MRKLITALALCALTFATAAPAQQVWTYSQPGGGTTWQAAFVGNVLVQGTVTTGTGSGAQIFTDGSNNYNIQLGGSNAALNVKNSAGTINLFSLNQVASAVNGVQLNSSATGVTASVQAVGTDSNIGLQLQPKGTGIVSATGPLGYPGSLAVCGAVTQATSRTTGVTLNKPCGQITMFSAAGATAAATFTVTDSSVAATDTVILNQASGTNLYELFVTAVGAGSFNVTFFTTGGVATDAPVINYSVVKSAAN